MINAAMRKAAKRARLLTQSAFAVVDLETTGWSRIYDEIIQIGIISHTGDVLLDTLIKPLNLILNTRIHGITNVMVADAPTFPEIYPALRGALDDKIVLSYNWGFDGSFILGNCQRHRLPQPVGMKGECIMRLFAQYVGGRNQKLTKAASHFNLTFDGKQHSAIADARMALDVLRKMADQADS